jgi:hypothetical protein
MLQARAPAITGCPDLLVAERRAQRQSRMPPQSRPGLQGNRDPRDRAAGPDRLILPAMQQTKQPFDRD